MPAIKYSAFDTETTGLNPFKGAKIFSWSTCDIYGNVEIYRDTKYSLSVTNKKIKYYNTKLPLQYYLNDVKIHKICHNFHFDYLMCLMSGYNVPEDTTWHCTFIIHKLLNNLQGEYGLDDLAYKFYKYSKVQDLTINQASKIYGGYDKIPQNLMYEYQYADAERGMMVFKPFYPLIEQYGMTQNYLREIELVRTTVRMERYGIMLDRDESNKLLSWMKEELKIVEDDCFKLLNRHVNLNSSKQVIKLLFGDKKETHCKHCGEMDFSYVNRKCKHCSNITFTDKAFFPALEINPDTEIPSTDKDVLDQLRNDIDKYDVSKESILLLDLILKKRSYTKGTASVNNFIAEACTGDIIHPNINTNEAVTGRESITRPPLQTVSKEKAPKVRYPIAMRKCLRARKDHFLLLVDYKNIEMRIAVQLTNSDRLMKLVSEDFDFHIDCAKLFYKERFTDRSLAINWFLKDKPKEKIDFRKSINEIGKEEASKNLYKKIQGILRTGAKNGRFAMLYGAGIEKVAVTLGLSIEETMKGYEEDKEKYPEFHLLMKDCIKQIKERGYVETLFGRRLNVFKNRSYASTDFRIQGTATELFKIAQIRVDNYYRYTWKDKLHLLLPEHDELISEIPNTERPRIQMIMNDIHDLMVKNLKEIKVKLDTEFKLSESNWNDAKPIELEKR